MNEFLKRIGMFESMERYEERIRVLKIQQSKCKHKDTYLSLGMNVCSKCHKILQLFPNRKQKITD